MLVDFFKLNPTFQIFTTQNELVQQFGISNDLRNIQYNPSTLENSAQYPKLKIRNKIFNNVSLSKTHIKNVVFINCTFEDCLFIGTEISNCEFHNTTFKNCNTFKIKIYETYINPKSFEKCIRGIEYSNIAVHLFQQLLNNSDDKLQSDFSRSAEFQFKKWQDQLTKYKFKKQLPYPISRWEFAKSYYPHTLYRLTFGYGLRLRNFAATFLIIFLTFFTINTLNWKSYGLHQKDLSIAAFDKDTSNLYSISLYTLDATTKLIDSQFQATTNSGMAWLAIQNVFGFILISALITIILNRFVK